MVDRGAAEWISSLPVSRANHSVLPAEVAGWTMTGGSGRTSHESLTLFDPESFSSRTYPDYLNMDSTSSSAILPGSGSMRNGRVSQRPMLGHRIDEPGCGLSPTPTAKDSSASGGQPLGTNVTLTDAAVRLWPTPMARDPKGPTGPDRHSESLPDSVQNWATPNAWDGSRGPDLARANRPESGGMDLVTQTVKLWPRSRQTGTLTTGTATTVLNPEFSGHLMGLPPRWSSTNETGPTETDSSRGWRLCVPVSLRKAGCSVSDYCELCGLQGAHWLGCEFGPRPAPKTVCQICSDVIADPADACTSDTDSGPFEVHRECCTVCADHKEGA